MATLSRGMQPSVARGQCRARPAGLAPTRLPRRPRPQGFTPMQQPQRIGHTAATLNDAVLAADPEVEFVGVISGMQTVKGTLLLEADASLVYALLTDYPSCNRVFRNIASSEVQYSEGRKQVLQACKWQFLTFAGTFNVLLDVMEEDDNGLLVFRLVSSSFMKDFEGRWQVTAEGIGRCRVDHVLAVKPSIPIPATIAQLTSRLFTQQVKGLLQDLTAEVQRQLPLGVESVIAGVGSSSSSSSAGLWGEQ